MNLASVENLAKAYGEKPLLGGVTFGIDEGDRIALVGRNGTGKTTLLRILAGEETPDAGRVVFRSGCRREYARQNPLPPGDGSVMDYMFLQGGRELGLLREYSRAAAGLQEAPEDPRRQDDFHRAAQVMEENRLWTLEEEVRTILSRLGIGDTRAPAATLSGGQLRRAVLARALIRMPDLLLLDEPTNHLDTEITEWLEKMLLRRRATVLFVSHDRAFLDSVATRMIELDRGRLFSVRGGYDAFLEARSRRQAEQETADARFRSLFEKELQWIRSGIQGRGTRQEARRQRFEAMQNDRPAGREAPLRLPEGSRRLGKKTLELRGVSLAYDDPLITDFSYTFGRRDRIGVVGGNGTGKTTFLELLAGCRAPDQGTVVRGETLRIGYFRQTGEDLPGEETLLEAVSPEQSGEAAWMLEHFGFPRGDFWKPVRLLSGGERRRLGLLKVLLDRPNLLLLDEPTNDLDLDTMLVLEGFLLRYRGMLVAVSHDRAFLDRLVTQIFHFPGTARIDRYTGNHAAFREARETSRAGLSRLAAAPPEPKPRAPGLSYRERLRLGVLEEEIERQEARLAAWEAEMEESACEYEALAALEKQRTAGRAALEELYREWTELAEKQEGGTHHER